MRFLIRIGFVCFAFVFMFSHYNGVAQTNVQKPSDTRVEKIGDGYSVVYVVNPKNRIEKYLYKDLLYGMKSLKKKVKIDFVDIADATDALFEQYGVVILANDRTTDTLRPNFYAFAKKHATKKNLITLAFLPKGRSKLANTQGIDVVSSASRERDAKRLVTSTVAPLCIEIFRSY